MSDDKDSKGRAERATSNVFTRLPQKLMQEMKEKKAKAVTSSVLTKFTQQQIQEMKEYFPVIPQAFTMIDQNRDGLIDVSDLKEMYSNLGLSPQDKTLQDMVKEAPGQLNFTMFLSLFSEKLSGSVPADTVLESMVKEAPGNQLNFTAFLSIFSDKLSGACPQDSVLQAMVKEAPQLNFTGFLSLFSDKMSGTDPEETLRQAFQMFDADNTGHIHEDYMTDLLLNMGDNFSKDELRQTMKEAPISGGKVDYNAFVNKIKGKEETQ